MQYVEIHWLAVIQLRPFHSELDADYPFCLPCISYILTFENLVVNQALFIGYYSVCS